MKVHFMGVGGSGISGVAELASKMGYEVTGCDLEVSGSYKPEDIEIIEGHDKQHIQDAELVIVSPAVFYQSSDNGEVLEAKRLNKLITWERFLGEYLHKDKKVVCIAGTHGKSTTTAMTINLFEDASLDPIGILGAKLIPSKKNYRYGKGDYFVTEADEFYDNFLNYKPEIIILNNIEFDHPDYFESEEKLFESYQKFVSNLKGEKILIANTSDLGVKKLLSIIGDGQFNLIPYSSEDNDLDISLKVLGKHNILNAIGVIKLGEKIGIKDSVIKSSLEDFEGIGRRFEKIYEENDIRIFDDYAHHPTAIRKTLEGAREKFPDNRILVVVEPHGYKRTKALLPLYKNAFDSADKVIVGPIFKSRDSESLGVDSKDIVSISENKNSIVANSLDEIKQILRDEVKKGDIIIVMGAGKSNIWAQELLKS